jgi:predicted ATPase
LVIRESGDINIPASRLSDGTLRFLALLALVYNPSPPSIICIEEPELGMHPDIIPIIAEMLIEASKNTQLIITTHSDLLVSKLKEMPETILVCDWTDYGTTLRRLTEADVKGWDDDISLGDIWLKGGFGGTRW